MAFQELVRVAGRRVPGCCCFDRVREVDTVDVEAQELPWRTPTRWVQVPATAEFAALRTRVTAEVGSVPVASESVIRSVQQLQTTPELCVWRNSRAIAAWLVPFWLTA